MQVPPNTSIGRTVQQSFHQGPLPPPDVLAEYDGVVDGGAERIMRMWEGEAAHRRTVQRRHQWTEGFQRIGGMVAAVGLTGGILWLGADLIKGGYDASGFVALSSGLVFVIGILITAYRAKK